jgi:hypothetical protein
MRIRRSGYLAVFFLCLSAITVFAQDIVIHAVNGKTGLPFAKNHLLVWSFDEPSSRGSAMQQLDLYTNMSGAAVIPSGTLKYKRLQVWIDSRHQCNASPNGVSIGVSEILRKGFVADNNCGGKIKSIAQPGTLVVYARAATFRERMNW